MNITDSIVYAGVNDHQLDMFEGQFNVPDGIAYNSYVVKGEKIAVLDAVEAKFASEWLGNIEAALDGRQPDYLVVHHMEPDHSSNIVTFLDKYPGAVVVSSAKAFTMMKNFYGSDFEDRRIVVGEGDTLDLGGHVLKFVTAPMVHWPEVIMSYDMTDKVLFSADAFGKFGANDVPDDDWACEARRYYFCIVGKYGKQVQALLKKLSALEIEKICPLHGPALTDNIPYYVDLYNTWSSYGNESEGVVIAYTSVYGNTKKAVELLAEKLEAKGCAHVSVFDLARCDMTEALEDAFRYGKIVLATTTYNADVFPFMRVFIEELLERGYKNKTVGIIENSSWAPMAGKKIKAMLEGAAEITFAENNVSITSALNDANAEQIGALAEELCG